MKDAPSGNLTIEYRIISELKPLSRNPRKHSKHQVRQIARSIQEFGFTSPILIDKDDRIVAGHGRVEGARLLRLSLVPTIRLEDLSPQQIRAYVIADNRLSENASWDVEILATELKDLLSIENDFDVTVTGFEIPEIDQVLSTVDQALDRDDSFEFVDSSEAVTEQGMLWKLGRHRILCGNALERASYSKLLGDKRASVIFTDPPYNVRIQGNVSGKGSVRHGEFQMASGEMTPAEFTRFLSKAISLMAEFTLGNSIGFFCIDWRHIAELLGAGKKTFGSLLNVCVWVKPNGGMGSFYRSRHELVFVFRKGRGRHRNNVQLGRFGRDRTNVWEYANVNGLSKSGDEGNLLHLHPTVKPVALIADALLDCSARGELVLDTFVGSGSTLIAAERTGRDCCGIEIDPIYVDTAIRRWQRYGGDHAVEMSTGKRFDDLSREKRGAPHGAE